MSFLRLQHLLPEWGGDSTNPAADALCQTATFIQAAGLNMTVEHGPWIAGGAVLAAWTAGDFSDIDVFFHDVVQLDTVVKAMQAAGFEDQGGPQADSGGTHEDGEEPFTPGIVHNFTTPWGKVNLAALLVWPSVKDVLDHFDITACCIAYVPGTVLMDQLTRDDIAARRLRFCCETSRSRASKYVAKGYALDFDDAEVLAGGGDLPGSWSSTRTLTARLREVVAQRAAHAAHVPSEDDIPW